MQTLKFNGIVKVIRSVICLAFILSFNTCKKDDPKEPYEISGYAYSGCPKQVLSNSKIDLYWNDASLSTATSGFLTGTTTDNNGYFKLTTDYNGNTKLLCDSQYVAIFFSKENVKDLIEINFHSSTILKFNLVVSNQYSVNDTLFIESNYPTGGEIKIPGPFNTGTLNGASLFYGLGDVVQNNSEYLSLRFIYYKINGTMYASDLIDINACDTSTVVLNIN